MLLWVALLLCVSMTEGQELFQNPQLSQYISSELSDVILKCMVKVDPKKPAVQLFYSFYKNNELVQDRSQNPVFSTEVKEENSGHYQCVVDTENGIIQKKSGYLDIEFWTPVSHPVLTLKQEATNLTVGDKVEFLCEAQKGSLPIFYSFYIDGEILGKALAPSGRAASLLVSVKAEWSAKNYSCEAKNNISRRISEPRKFPLVVSGATQTKNNMLSIWLPASLFGGMVIAAGVLICFFKPCKKDARPETPTPTDPDYLLYALVDNRRYK
ncbi:Fc receptor-like protein 6 [Apodemus sylvaticus]|uniref:Fc receptor-like protein 6 n=1 Tax=Apodemus sylvaticus TaxID=10129 RepID=UPI00224319EA|nr:Fc receptor-like protein 6 [Apodemus sylvaticus]